MTSRGLDGAVIVHDAVGPDPEILGRLPASISKPRARDGDWVPLYTCVVGADAAVSSVSVPVALGDGTTGFLTVADPEDGRPFSPADRLLLEHLAATYAVMQSTPTRREVLRLRSDVRAVRRQAIRAAEGERQRLARELHDDIGHALTTAILSLDMSAQRVPANSAARDALTAGREALTECANCLHEFAFHLRPRVLNDLGLTPALRGLARRVCEMGTLDAVVTVHGRERRLGDDTELAAFRIVQEALTNALKHARATRISIDVTFADGSVELEICDDGAGFNPATVNRDRGRQGLLGMRERAELAGGVLDLQSRQGYGTTVWARLPIGEDNHE